MDYDGNHPSVRYPDPEMNLPDEIDAGHAYAAGILKNIGFGSLRILRNGRWTGCAFTASGVSWD
jgi:hypothetical protein